MPVRKASRILDWTNWAAFFIPVLTEMLTDFATAMRFVAAKRNYLARYEGNFSERAKKVILRLFEDGEQSLRAGISAAKWIRMTKVSKPTATRDLTDLEKIGAVTADGGGPQTRYFLTIDWDEPIESLNEPLREQLLHLVETHPGVRLPYLSSVVSPSRATVKRALAALIAEG